MEEAQAAVEKAIGGENVTTTVEGRERYPVNVRYMRDFRSDLGRWAGSWWRPPAARDRSRFPQLAAINPVSGPSMIRDEDGLLTGYVYVDIAGRDPEQLHRGGRPPAQGEGEAAARLRRFLERPIRGVCSGSESV